MPSLLIFMEFGPAFKLFHFYFKSNVYFPIKNLVTLFRDSEKIAFFPTGRAAVCAPQKVRGLSYLTIHSHVSANIVKFGFICNFITQ